MVKVIRAVLRGGGDSNAASLPDTINIDMLSIVKHIRRKGTTFGIFICYESNYYYSPAIPPVFS
jgi:hypothetical protein